MACLLCLDISNSVVTVGAFEDGRLSSTWRLASEPNRTADEYGLLLRRLMDGHTVPPAGVVLASVVPVLAGTLRRACQTYLQATPLVVGPGVRTGLRVSTENPRELGADRIANAVAAWRLYGAPTVVVDFGTATTFDVIGAAGDYLGAVIAPGVALAAQALAREAAQLPGVDLVPPAHTIGRSTTSALQSGIVYGSAALVEGLLQRVRRELGTPCRTVATGRFAEVVRTATAAFDVVDLDLTLQGLRLIWELNRG